jgi:glycosyltransferase involved in cell wall biosynthesis
VISGSLRYFLGLSERKSVIIPLGGERQPTTSKTFNEFHLLYVGSLDNRNIHETILGLSVYLQKKDACQNLTYDIIGFGKEKIIQLLKKTIEDTGQSEIVTYHGRKNRDELFPFFEKCNVGVAYLPKTKAYDFQPVTKLFECMLAGMPVIASDTLENKLSVKPGCGELCSDNPESFADALKRIIDRAENFDSEKIKNCYSGSEWKNIVHNTVEPYFDSYLKNK